MAKIEVVEGPIAAEMRRVAATLLGVSGRDWRAKVADCAPPWLPCSDSIDDDAAKQFKQMPADMQLQVRAADLIENIPIGEADFLSVCGDDLEELRKLCARARPARRAA